MSIIQLLPVFIFVVITYAGPIALPNSNTDVATKTISADFLMDAFEVLRQLILASSEETKEPEIRLAQHYSPLQRLDPLCLGKPVVYECQDSQTPTLGKIVLTLENVKFTGLSTFKVEQISNSGPCLTFRHVVAQLDTCANYTVDYYLFNSIPLRISEGTLKATIPRAKISGRFFSFASVVGDWSRMSQFNLTTTVDDDVNLMVYPKYTISDRFVLKRQMDKFDAAIRKTLPEMGEILKNAYSHVIEMKLLE